MTALARVGLGKGKKPRVRPCGRATGNLSEMASPCLGLKMGRAGLGRKEEMREGIRGWEPSASISLMAEFTGSCQLALLPAGAPCPCASTAARFLRAQC